MDLKLKSLYIDCPNYADDVAIDDFIVAVGKTKTNSVYHVFEAKAKPHKNPRMKRNYLKVLKSDLITALRRESTQKLIPITWYSRSKK